MKSYIDCADFDMMLMKINNDEKNWLDETLKQPGLESVGRDVVVAYLVGCIKELSKDSGVDEEDIIGIVFGFKGHKGSALNFENILRISCSLGYHNKLKGLSCLETLPDG